MSQQCQDRPESTATAQRPLLDEPLLDSKDAADLLAVKPSWIYEAVRSGKLPYLKIGRHIRFLRSDLERWVLDQRQR